MINLPPPMLPPPPPPTSSGPVHEPVPDERELPTRRRMLFFDRIKVLLIIGLIFFFVIAKRRADIPVMSVGEALREQLRAKTWLVWLAGVEVVRQAHYLISERSAPYHQWWQNKVWHRWAAFAGRRSPWLRYRIARILKVAFWVMVGAFFFASRWHVAPTTAIAEAPSRLWNNAFATAQGMPMIIYITFIVSMSILQFAAIFWFMSRGGVDTYMPQEVKTRFADVWGQDRVLEKVKENIVFLEKPEEIESKGGHVPGGILLWGPPGTGKTLMAEAVAGETGRPYVFVDPGAFQNMFFGVGILKVKSLFRKLRKLALRHGGVIVFFDEADSLGNRGAAVAGSNATAGAVIAPTCNGLHYIGETRFDHGFAAPPAAAPAEVAPMRTRWRDAIMMPGYGGGGMGTLQALLTELSGLKKPRGFFSRRVRQFLGMPPKEPPKYRMLIMMATNMPDALDEALLRPGRIDRRYQVGYPSVDGRRRTYAGYLDKVRHQITPDQISRISLMTPNGTGASIKDIVNEAVIVAMREGRDVVTWPDLLSAKSLKTYGMPDDVHEMALERHAVALHEAGHAVAAYRLMRRHVIDISTIEPRGSVGGFVSHVPTEQEGFPWRSIQERRVMVCLASLATERAFYGGDNSVGVGGDLATSTGIVAAMAEYAAMDGTLASHAIDHAVNGPDIRTDLGKRVEAKLQELFERTQEFIEAEQRFVMAIAHALEEHYTVSGEDVAAIMQGSVGPVVDGRWYHTDDFVHQYRRYHEAALYAFHHQTQLMVDLPRAPLPVAAYAGGFGGFQQTAALPPPGAPRRG